MKYYVIHVFEICVKPSCVSSGNPVADYITISLHIYEYIHEGNNKQLI